MYARQRLGELPTGSELYGGGGRFAIRTIYRFDTKADGSNVFEERIVCFEAASSEEAHAKDDREAKDYALSIGGEAHPQQFGYRQDDDPLIDGYEVWSQLFEARESLDQFYSSRYSRYEYTPDA